ncbi:molybdopterin-dependent oxidoreductase [Pseudanabaena sp. FACHB-1998]|uniref:molybdopterin-dependent oxidoreductase n=1 Tax=Pseudanabaena sp. FACHB-1998 TaxID=2692858 RepID=UPI001681B5C8|nr:molybdopterin-dependent oxidoreductase [Pseudanabaena sp. FACHB-1998]MBD2176989.1 molybdopterin-dependent oxidoreductase [Pseudanabaena sp. FACHB-1998]
MQFDKYIRNNLQKQLQHNLQRRFSRRQMLQFTGLSGLGLALGSCGTSLYVDKVRPIFEPLNQSIEELILKPQTPVPEFPASAIEPEALLVNSFDFTPIINPNTFKLVIDGAVDNPLQLSMSDMRSLPLTSMVIRHVCVEGWAAIVQWGGVRLLDLAKLVQPQAGARYVYFESADGYYESWDIASSLHPQTLLAYQKNGETIPVENGAPLRLASPIKLGYKQSKWVIRVTFAKELSQRRGYWVDEGYEWFAGL